MKVLIEDLEARRQPLYFWRWGEAAKLTVLGLDPKLSRYFRQDKTLVQLIRGMLLIHCLSHGDSTVLEF